MTAALIPFLSLGVPRTVEFELTVLDNQSGWRTANRRVVEGTAHLSGDGSLAIRWRETGYRFYVLPGAPVEFETILIRQEREFYVDHDRRTVQESACGCGWGPMARPDWGPQCSRLAAQFGGSRFAGRGTVNGIPVATYEGETQAEAVSISLAPGRGCEVMSYWQGLSLAGFARYGRRYRVIRLNPGEPPAAVFQPPPAYRFLPPR